MTSPRDRTWEDYVHMAEYALVQSEVYARDSGVSSAHTVHYLKYADVCTKISMAKKELKNRRTQ